MNKTIDAGQVRAGLDLALKKLNREKDNLNALNLYPVADKDTGSNLVHSMSLTVKNLPQEESAAALFRGVSELMLKYAYGSSGTILNLFFEGFANALEDRNTLSGKDLAKAFDQGIKYAIYAVEQPEKGTILSVGLQSARAGLSMLEVTEDASLIWQRITEEAHASLQLTPFQNPRLIGSGVVDSGAYGLCLILDGFMEGFDPNAKVIPYPQLIFPDNINSQSVCPFYRYCTEFVAKIGDMATLEDVKNNISSLGNCFLCVTNKDSIKIHIHTNKPDKVLELAKKIGSIHSQKVDDMKSFTMV